VALSIGAALSLLTTRAGASPEPAAASAKRQKRATHPAGATGMAPNAPPALKLGDGLLVGEGPDAKCLPKCGFPRLTDPDANGDLDGFGYEGQRTCIADGTSLALSSPLCDVTPLANPPPPGNGIFRETRCVPVCSSALTDRDPKTGMSDGWGYERRRNCIVPGSAAALGGLPCDPGEKPLPAGDGIDVVGGAGKIECRPFCRNPAESDPDGDGFGYEYEQSCIVSASLAALQGIPCDAPDLPPPPPPPPPPPGEGWSSEYTATMFGEVDCARLGFDDPGDSDLNHSTCISSGAVSLNVENRVYFGATGDLSSLWSGPPCVCQGREQGGVCRTPPACPDQGNCGQCVEVTCNFEGKYSFQSDGLTHDEFCRPGRSVVVQLIDACPHNHPNNQYWCTQARPEHIDISCSAFRSISVGRDIAQIGSLNVRVRRVDCSVGLGVKTF
jgi:hypothetical protein